MLSFITPVAYDFPYAFEVIKSYYDIADEIILGLDRDRISFSKKTFPFDQEAFYRGLHQIDVKSKIRLIEDDFHSMDHPLGNEHAERQILTQAAKKGNWIIQIDSDEILVNPDDLVAWIQSVPDNFSIRARWYNVYKRIGSALLMINDNQPYITIGTKDPHSIISNRETNQQVADSPLILMHYAYGRTRFEVEMKLRHWGHSQEIDFESTLATWDQVTLDTYSQVQNFHPLYPPWWPSLIRLDVSS